MDEFFSPHHLRESLPRVLEGFLINLRMMLIAELLVLVWALVIVAARLAPGRRFAPLRWLAVAYVDIFRGIPLIILFVLVGFGLPELGHPFSDINLFWRSVLALVLTYGAFVAENYRAGIESIHPSQVAAARSIGLSRAKTMRFVVLPQAIRRVLPPMMNDFVSLQKDTALASVLGVLEALNVSNVYAGNHLNYSSVVGAGIMFLLITIPCTRLTDVLASRTGSSRTGLSSAALAR